MKNIKQIFCLLSVIGLSACQQPVNKDWAELHENFQSPPESARPGVYWYFMDGNLSKEGMTKDLEAMKRAGIGSVVFLEVNVGIPRGNVDFLSEEWKSCFKHAVKECERLGISMTLGIGPGWTGSGGPWVKAEQSMRHLVASSTLVNGAGKQTIRLEKPSLKAPYFGEGAFTPELKERWKEYYEDVAVLAFPTPGELSRIKDIGEKALYYRAPYSSVPGVKQYLSREDFEPVGKVIQENEVVDLTSLLQEDGSITWNVPEGNWTIMRFGIRNNGAVTRPAPLPGVGFECDKTDTASLKAHFQVFTDELMRVVGERDTTLPGGLKCLHMDSWEMGAQNWTPGLRDAFKKRRGYDPQPYYPIYAGYIVGSPELSERFLWDLRQTMQELMIENHSGYVKRYAHQRGMRLSIEPYDMNPMQDLELGASADIPMCEFWSPGGYNTSFSAVEGSSIGNIKGQRLVPAEAFTAHGDGWKQHPASMKNQTDWAFAAGINRLTYHTFQHQALPDSLRPGMTMGPYGVHWDRNQTWWPYASGYHTYVSRCQYLLQSGRTVADILYLAPEEAPFVFRAPKSAWEGVEEYLPDKKGYNFDACPASLLYQASVKGGKIYFPSGAQYELLVLPDFERMTPKLLGKIQELVRAGATLVGLPPKEAPGLSDYPNNDKEVERIVQEMWGVEELPSGLEKRVYGKGMIYYGKVLEDQADNLYPDYALTAAILKEKQQTEDFASASGTVRYIHKQRGDVDYYFVANRTGEDQHETCSFRISGKKVQLWDPITGEILAVPSYTDNGETISVDLSFAPYQSYFLFFGENMPQEGLEKMNLATKKEVMTLNQPWTVCFDPAWGGPQKVSFAALQDWSKHPNDSIRYYSGTAVYTTRFEFHPEQQNYFLDLGDVKNMAKVYLNGQDLGIVWTTPWKVDLAQALQEGTNELRIEVTNLWPNRLIGDERNPEHRYTYTTFKHYTADSPLLPSGLLGPVRILVE